MSDVATPTNPQKVMIGNFKGVMLCNRPFAGISAVTTKQKCKDGSSFICGTVAKPWGSNVAIAEKSRVLTRLSKKDGALSKHKKWLKDLQEERERIEKERENEAQLKEEKKRKFMEKEAKKRSVGWENEDEIINCQGGKETCKGKSSADWKDNFPPQGGGGGGGGGKENDKPTQSLTKPAWALTESTSHELNETTEAKEEEELLSFVNDFDLDKYSHDLELQALMDQVKGRIHALQRDMKVDEARLNAAVDSAMAALSAEKLNSTSEIDMSFIHSNGNGKNLDGDEDDIQSIAESVRSESSFSSNSGSVHSQKSLQSLVASRSSKAKMGSTKSFSSSSFGPLDPVMEVFHENNSTTSRGEINIQPPILVTHTEDDGARLAETKSLNKLPFKNRNPAL
mmetsp:Transcript_5546/g.8166  ORF Transcript_5546/g.8166 Transcript_5546/m.8166 type:complete len:397 (+) Transcript_5546:172-1362(+)